MVGPTYDDANVLIQMVQWGTTYGVLDAVNWLWGHGPITDYEAFIAAHPPGSESYNHLARIVTYFETVGTLYKHGLFNGELLFDWVPIGSLWDMVKAFAVGQREKLGNSGLYSNFERMAQAAPC